MAEGHTTDGRLALAVSAEDLKLWSLQPPGKLATLSQKTGPVTVWALAPGGRFAPVSRARATTQWDVEDRCALAGVSFPVRSCALAPDGGLGLFGSPSGEVLLSGWAKPSWYVVQGACGDWVVH